MVALAFRDRPREWRIDDGQRTAENGSRSCPFGVPGLGGASLALPLAAGAGAANGVDRAGFVGLDDHHRRAQYGGRALDAEEPLDFRSDQYLSAMVGSPGARSRRGGFRRESSICSAAPVRTSPSKTGTANCG